MTENLPNEIPSEPEDDSQSSGNNLMPEENSDADNSTKISTQFEPTVSEKNVTKPIYHAPWSPSFHGEGSKYFVIRLINAILQVITFNFYYPWAKAEKLNYLYEQTEFAGSRFKFHGTGKEMFIGYLKMLLIVAFIYGGFWWAKGNEWAILGFLILYGGLIVVYPLAIHGTAKYRLSRTSWRGIFFGYRGELGELFAKFFLGILLSFFTLGIYWSWVQVDLRRYVTQHIRFGDTKFDFTGKGNDLFWIKFKYVAFSFVAIVVAMIILIFMGAFGAGISNMLKPDSTDVLSAPSVGIILWLGVIYLFLIVVIGTIALMRQREIFQFYADNTHAWQNEQWHGVRLNMTFIDLLQLSIVNMLLMILTLGIATPFVEIRNLHFMIPRLEIDGTFDPDSLIQTESDYRDAMGEDVGDWLDIDLA
ncbi:hypothetical protein EMA8858_02132 [Emticicia aquatica]|jgi:uncharacterized membrane protein YjgN (DUF898 family)|uniref:DUF898 domain-containing protein n=1 Tax=Emticicia aquatica TaxID=1681835 RepID=A0ABN8EWK3_9BACT|nr:YjgN family protein [Emticicia aquatica]CAH0996004.1 hypothetical protein EMA8858_02132 [Emticicia aquatica]